MNEITTRRGPKEMRRPTYVETVFLESRIVGEIRFSDKGWRYHPKGKSKLVGEFFKTRTAVLKSLEMEGTEP